MAVMYMAWTPQVPLGAGKVKIICAYKNPGFI